MVARHSLYEPELVQRRAEIAILQPAWQQPVQAQQSLVNTAVRLHTLHQLP